MGNVFFFWDGSGGPPSGWSEIDPAYQNRLISINSTPYILTGADQHSNGAGMNNSTPTASSQCNGSYGGSIQMIAHNTLHGHGQDTITVSPSNNLPAYKNFRLFYRSTSGWDQTLPAGAIIFLDTTQPIPANWFAVEINGSAFIRVSASYGGTGGGDTTGHTISGTSGNNTQADGSVGSPSGGLLTARYHNHNFSTTTSVHSLDFYFWAAGMIKATTNTRVPVNGYLLFDATQGAGWQSVGTPGQLLRICSYGAILTGGTYNGLHNHGGSWFYSSMFRGDVWTAKKSKRLWSANVC